jgi:hypothetical protein
MQFVNIGLNILNMNDSILIIKKMWKKTLIRSNINVGFKIVGYVLINYGKMQLLNNDFNMLKVDGSIHVPCYSWKNIKKTLIHYNAV